MSLHHSHINTATTLIRKYTGEFPFANYLKEFFREFKKYGGRDRKTISQLCYGYYRAGACLEHLDLQEKLLAGFYLTTASQHPLLEALQPDNNRTVTDDLPAKLERVQAGLSTTAGAQQLFPFYGALTAAIDRNAYCFSLLQQPETFLRIRPGKEQLVEQTLQKAAIPFHRPAPDTIALPVASAVTDLLETDRDVVVQDLSSQQVASMFPDLSSRRHPKIWDCCAASGGKSLLLFDRYPQMKLTVSDIRETILHNLGKRFEKAGLKEYRMFCADLSRQGRVYREHPGNGYDLVVADVPCSGSGTWARTPEAPHFFKKEKIGEYAALQQQIIRNTTEQVAHNGYYLYITCSVFDQENEAQVDFIRSLGKLQLVKQAYFTGMDQRADTLFAALFTASPL